MSLAACVCGIQVPARNGRQHNQGDVPEKQRYLALAWIAPMYHVNSARPQRERSPPNGNAAVRANMRRAVKDAEIHRRLRLHNGFAPILGLIPFPHWRRQPAALQ